MSPSIQPVARPVLALVLLAALQGCGQPQMGPDREAFRAVDSLYTAIALREPAQVARSASTLDELTRAGTLPDPASEALKEIIRETHEDHWEAAQTHLREFMLGQHR